MKKHFIYLIYSTAAFSMILLVIFNEFCFTLSYSRVSTCACVYMCALPLSPFVMFVNDPFVNLVSFAHAQSFERRLEVVRSRNPGTSQTDVRPTTHVVH